MTDEAHAKAVEAAREAYRYAESDYDKEPDPIEAAITAYLATMAEAGRVMVRVPDKPRGPSEEEWALRMRGAVAKGSTDEQG